MENNNKSKLTLIIDGNWLLMSRLSVMNSKYAPINELTRDLKLLMARSISIMLKQFPKIDNIILVADGGSWRCDLPIPEFLEKDNITYKGNREQDPELDWDSIFGAYTEFQELMAKSGITVCREFGVEGDDWCWNLSRRLNKQGTNVIIWSMDKDLTQLVQTDKDGCFTVTWNKLYMTKQAKPESEMDFLFNFNYSANEGLLGSIERKAKEIREVNPTDIVIDKIIRGDAGDNILPIILKEGKTKQFKVSQKDIDLSLNVLDEVQIDNYLLNLLSQKSYKDKVNKAYQDIFDHFIYNRKLVWLNETSYPQEILDRMNNVMIGPMCTNIQWVQSKLEAEKHSKGNNELFDSI